MNGNNADQIIDRIQQINGVELSEQHREEIELWQKGRALAHVTSVYGFDVLMEMIEGYAQAAIAQSIRQKPGDNERVIAAHAVAYALSEFHGKLLQDIAAAIDAARTAPDIVKHGLQSAMGQPVDSL